ncbi:DNA-methyltransferase [Chloroflexota bacterium]
MRRLKTSLLYLGDNLEILRKYIPDKSIDLIYLDPPFNSKKNYHIVCGGSNGKHISRVEKAFSDTWVWDKTKEETFEALRLELPVEAWKLIEGTVEGIGATPGAAYLVMITPRLLELHRVLKDTGSIYLHCDPTASHYLKIILDRIFGVGNFRNEIVWSYKGGGRSKKQFARKHDIILFYTRSDRWTFNYEDILVDRANRTYFTDSDGRRYWLKYGKKYYIEHDGKVPEDWWADIDPLHGPYRERLGYPTQKPLALLERIVKASSNEGDIVLDPFCGSGTAIVAAQRLNRRWLGIDNAPSAIELTQKRFKDKFDIGIEVVG